MLIKPRSISFLILLFTLIHTPTLAYADDQPGINQEIGTLEQKPKHTRSWYTHILRWFPNRLIDIVDFIKLDLGVGITAGGNIRATTSRQSGYRWMDPGSFRVGLMGRRFPFMIENQTISGKNHSYPNIARITCKDEFGIGIDAIIPAAYILSLIHI